VERLVGVFLHPPESLGNDPSGHLPLGSSTSTCAGFGAEVWSSMKYELRHMDRRGSGEIVNNASVGALTGNPGIGSYIASKHGVVGLTRTAALEYIKKGIYVNAVNPGLIDTQIARDVVSGDERAGYRKKSTHPACWETGRDCRSRAFALQPCGKLRGGPGIDRRWWNDGSVAEHRLTGSIGFAIGRHYLFETGEGRARGVLRGRNQRAFGRRYPVCRNPYWRFPI
jgi:hypothetical protein